MNTTNLSTEHETTTSKKKTKGIVCDVRNCIHHDGQNHCTAEQISIGPSYATSCTDTVCATFRQKML
ncbi:MAG: DUF1540 domain-containing protein [Oscillospiraceae bacterium]|nr:DUF1540 domain-containing protein [Oscillospiraceae bacterium]